MTEPIKVLVVDDHQMVRAGIVALLAATADVVVVGQAGDGCEAVDVAARTLPDVVLMDLSMPRLDGVEATRRILEEEPATKVVVLTSFSDRQRVSEALTAGAVGYLLKDCEPVDLLAAVRSAAAGQVPLDPRVAGVLLPRGQGRPEDAMSPRELQVLGLVAQGLANKQIGRRLGISERTVKAHLGRVFRALGVADRTSAALWAHDHLSDEAGQRGLPRVATKMAEPGVSMPRTLLQPPHVRS
jgi:DNA-binding NarL/FixJ family response regulator